MNMALRLPLLASLSMSALAAAQTAELPQPLSFSVGDSWEWVRTDTRTRLQEGRDIRTVVEVEGTRMFTNGRRQWQISESYVGRPAARPWRVWPLEVGSHWVYEGTWSRSDGATGDTKQDVKVAVVEEVTVPAGKFMAYRIEYRGWYSSSTGNRGRQDETYWYSPEARTDVKRTYDDGHNAYTVELTSIKRASR